MMNCNFINCTEKTYDESGYCYHHRNDKPTQCAVCLNSIHQINKPLICGHWIHKKCIQKSGKSECPICRSKLNIKISQKYISKLYDDLDEYIETIEIPYTVGIISLVCHLLYMKFIPKSDRKLSLKDFLSGFISNYIDVSHPAYKNIVDSYYVDLDNIVTGF
jgi:hypothetical protein